jgi:hydrocephalus-inducing protein
VQARRIKVLAPDSPFFEVVGPRSPATMSELKQSKIAAGMEVCFVIKFRPQEVRDYRVDLVCVTEREKFIVPVHALGHRAVLNLPDQVDFGVCPVKSTNTRSIIAQNVGSSQARFTLSCTKSVFTASPAEGIVEVGQTIMVEIQFTPSHSEEYQGDLVVSYDDGEQVYMALAGVSENVDVSLSSPTVALDAAYISLSSQRTIKVYNASEIPVRFTWKQFLTTNDEEDERARLFGELEAMQELETEELEKDIEDMSRDGAGMGSDEDDDASALSGEEDYGPRALRAARAALSRKYRHLRRALEEDQMAFADQNFEVKRPGSVLLFLFACFVELERLAGWLAVESVILVVIDCRSRSSPCPGRSGPGQRSR